MESLEEYFDRVFSKLFSTYLPEDKAGYPGLFLHTNDGVYELEFRHSKCRLSYRQDENDPNKIYAIFKMSPPSYTTLEEMLNAFNKFKSSSSKIEKYVRGQDVRIDSGYLVVEWELKSVPKKLLKIEPQPSPSDLAAFIKGYMMNKFARAAQKLKPSLKN